MQPRSVFSFVRFVSSFVVSAPINIGFQLFFNFFFFRQYFNDLFAARVVIAQKRMMRSVGGGHNLPYLGYYGGWWGQGMN